MNSGIAPMTYTVLGKDAINLPASATEFYQKTHGRILNSLGNERQERAFEQLAVRHQQELPR